MILIWLRIAVLLEYEAKVCYYSSQKIALENNITSKYIKLAVVLGDARGRHYIHYTNRYNTWTLTSLLS